MDVRSLLGGGKVPLWKTETDWKLSLEGLLEIGKNGGLGDGETDGGTGGRGMDYKGYLRFLIFGSYNSSLVYRMMDVMQLVIGKGQPGFSMDHCACCVDIEAAVSGKHVFFSAGLWKSQEREERYVYETRMAVAGSYLEPLKDP